MVLYGSSRSPYLARAAGCLLLDHVVIYGLALFVVCVCMRVCGVHACVFVVVQFLHLSLQARLGSHVESNSVIIGIDTGSKNVDVGFRGIC